jgi:hypothetical protein
MCSRNGSRAHGREREREREREKKGEGGSERTNSMAVAHLCRSSIFRENREKMRKRPCTAAPL